MDAQGFKITRNLTKKEKKAKKSQKDKQIKQNGDPNDVEKASSEVNNYNSQKWVGYNKNRQKA